MRTCARCDELRPDAEFIWRDTSGQSGLSARCAACRSHRSCPACEEIRGRSRGWGGRCPEHAHVESGDRVWGPRVRQEPRPRTSPLKRSGRRRGKASGSNISRRRRLEVHGRDGWRCVYCGSPWRLTLDHIVPWALGGSSANENLVTACLACNEADGRRVVGFIHSALEGRVYDDLGPALKEAVRRRAGALHEQWLRERGGPPGPWLDRGAVAVRVAGAVDEDYSTR